MASGNPWQLYESVSGWEQASAALTNALNEAIKGYHLARAGGVPSGLAQQAANNRVWAVMLEYRDYGATDSEPMHYLEYKLDKECK
jgi:hypothetical protein